MLLSQPFKPNLQPKSHGNIKAQMSIIFSLWTCDFHSDGPVTSILFLSLGAHPLVVRTRPSLLLFSMFPTTGQYQQKVKCMQLLGVGEKSFLLLL